MPEMSDCDEGANITLPNVVALVSRVVTGTFVPGELFGVPTGTFPGTLALCWHVYLHFRTRGAMSNI